MELVCPAGSLPALKTAVDNGADAVYFGFRDSTNARQFAGLNFNDNFKFALARSPWVRAYSIYRYRAIDIEHSCTKNASTTIASENLSQSSKHQPEPTKPKPLRQIHCNIQQKE